MSREPAVDRYIQAIYLVSDLDEVLQSLDIALDCPANAKLQDVKDAVQDFLEIALETKRAQMAASP